MTTKDYLEILNVPTGFNTSSDIKDTSSYVEVERDGLFICTAKSKYVEFKQAMKLKEGKEEESREYVRELLLRQIFNCGMLPIKSEYL